jgi:hypothetical protein
MVIVEVPTRDAEVSNSVKKFVIDALPTTGVAMALNFPEVGLRLIDKVVELELESFVSDEVFTCTTIIDPTDLGSAANPDRISNEALVPEARLHEPLKESDN